MRRKHTGDLVVIDDDEEKPSPLGIITDRDYDQFVTFAQSVGYP
jgi:hypothetical protein